MTASPTDEHALAASALAGDEAALGRLLAIHQQTAYNVAYRLLGSEADARDAVQEAFLLAVRAVRGGSSGPREADRFQPWLRRVVVNAALGQLRRRPTFRETPVDDLAEALPDPGQREPLREAERREVRGDILRAMLTLPDSQRAALTLREYEELTYDEIAEQLGVTRPAVERLLFRARRGLRAAYEGLSADPRPIGCAELGPRLSAMIDDEANAAAWDDVRAHLDTCADCRQQVDELRRARRLYALIPLLALPAAWEPVEAALSAAGAGSLAAGGAGGAAQPAAGASSAAVAGAATGSATSAPSAAVAATGAASSTAAAKTAVGGGLLSHLAGMSAAKAAAVIAAASVGVAALAVPSVGRDDAPPTAQPAVASPSAVTTVGAVGSPSVASTPFVGASPVASPALLPATPVPATAPSPAASTALPSPVATPSR